MVIDSALEIESETTLERFLVMNVAASDNDKIVRCIPNNTQDHYCYKLHIECKFVMKCYMCMQVFLTSRGLLYTAKC